MKYLAMIQARCSSTRLPNKVMKDLCGKPQLQRVVERVHMSKCIDEVMVITSIDKSNLPIVSLCANLSIRVGIGSENDVLDRYYQTAKLLQPEYVIRITGDCPLIDSELIDDAISKMGSDVDYCSNTMTPTFPDGLDFEIIKFSALEKSWREAVHSFEREHVTQYIIQNQSLFNCMDYVSLIGDYSNQRWTVDEQEDYEFVKKIYTHFTKGGDAYFGYKEVLGYLEDNPQLMSINSMFMRNEGLEKSIKEDKIVNSQV